MRRMRRALVLAALAPLACSRDLSLPDDSPPRVDAIQLVGLEASPAPVPLPVLAGELVAIRGSGLPVDATQLEVRVGSEDAEVLDATPERLVVRIPTLAAIGGADVQVRTPRGYGSRQGAVRYDGPGAPGGLGTSDLRTAVPLGFVAPVEPPAASGFPDLAIAIGASDAALLVAPEAGLAVATISLGLVPASAAARIKQQPDGKVAVEVLAAARGGEVALGRAIVSGGALVDRVAPRQLSHGTVSPAACSSPQVTFTHYGPAVAAWIAADGQQRIAAVDETRLAADEYAPAV